ncbi:FAD-dependent oxidoreductase [bacterium]|nr:FAD-dependent oxidoreductase [bacterium]
MAHFPFLIIGGGMTADSAAVAIRQHHPGASIGMISAELHSPYNRPPLSKGLWKQTKLEDIWRATPDLGIDLILGRAARSIDPNAHKVTDDQGGEYTYDKLLLATGAEPRRLPNTPEGVIYYRTLDDYHKLRQIASAGMQVAIIGGGFIGSELAAGLAMNYIETTMIFPDDGICSRIFPKPLAIFMTESYVKRGVGMIPRSTVESIAAEKDGRFLLRTRTRDGQAGIEVRADVVVAGLGVSPRIDLARDAGLEVADGIVVNEFCQTTHEDIYAAGDVAAFFNPALQARIRVEHEDNANTMGETAGRNMAGDETPYNHLPFFYSDLFVHGYEAVGETNAALDTFADWKQENQEGIIYYLRDGFVRGVLAWNTYGHIDEARELIGRRLRVGRPEDMKGIIAA